MVTFGREGGAEIGDRGTKGTRERGPVRGGSLELFCLAGKHCIGCSDPNLGSGARLGRGGAAGGSS